MKKLVVIGALLAPLASLAVNVLWFTVNSGASVNDSAGNLVGTVAGGFLDANGNPVSVNAVRVSIADAGSLFEQYLRLYYETENGWETADGVNVALLDDDYAAIWQPAELSEDIDPAAKVRIELGYIDMTGGGSGGVDFTPAAFAEATLADLLAQHVSHGGTSVQTQTPWTPSTYTVFTVIPEPTATLLLAVGMAVLALRRRAPPR